MQIFLNQSALQLITNTQSNKKPLFTASRFSFSAATWNVGKKPFKELKLKYYKLFPAKSEDFVRSYKSKRETSLIQCVFLGFSLSINQSCFPTAANQEQVFNSQRFIAVEVFYILGCFSFYCSSGLCWLAVFPHTGCVVQTVSVASGSLLASFMIKKNAQYFYPRIH